MLMLRLMRTGKKNAPHYSIVVTEKTNPATDGNFVEKLGHFSPTLEQPVFKVDQERVQHWISVGARPSETLARLLHKEGMKGMEKFVDLNKQYKKKNKKAPAEEEAPAESPSADESAEAPAAEETPAEAEPAAEAEAPAESEEKAE